MGTTFFSGIDDFETQISDVYNFLNNCKETVINYLRSKGGKIELSPIEQTNFKFCFQEMEGFYTVKSIELDKSDGYVLIVESKSGDTYIIAEDIFHTDLYIQSTIIDKILKDK